MPSLRLSEIDELMLDEDELDEVQLRRRKRKEKKSRPNDKNSRLRNLDPDNGGEFDSTDVDE